MFQRVWGRGQYASEGGVDPGLAVQEALESLYDDYAYEFQIGWSLWVPEAVGLNVTEITQLAAGARVAAQVFV